MIDDAQEGFHILPVVEDKPVIAGPGEFLRKARITAGLTEAQIAKRLRLSKDFIRAIECDDYSALSSFTFVRGYLRSYARIVDVSGDEVVASFDALGVEEPERYFAKQEFYVRKVKVKGSSLRWMAYVAGIVLIVAVSFWWSSRREAITPVVSQQSIATTLLPASGPVSGHEAVGE